MGLFCAGRYYFDKPAMQLKKQTSGLTEKSRSVYQTNCEMAVVKAAL